MNSAVAEVSIQAGNTLFQSIVDAVNAITTSNQERYSSFEEKSEMYLKELQGEISGLNDKIEGWFNERLEWIEKLYDQDLRQYLEDELTYILEATQENLGARY
jgi:hypothetical protein